MKSDKNVMRKTNPTQQVAVKENLSDNLAIQDLSCRLQLHWDRVEQFNSYGGIRIEDNIIVGEQEVINLTQRALGNV